MRPAHPVRRPDSATNDPQAESEPDLPTQHRAVWRALTILWPAFVMAGVQEMLVFAVIDPGELRWFGGPLIGWSATAVYTVTFLIFWGVISLAGALTMMLVSAAEPRQLRTHGQARRWP